MENVTNEVKGCGVLNSAPVFSHEFDGVQYYTAVVSAKRESGDKYDYIKVYFPDDDKYSQVHDKLVRGQTIEYKGFVTNSTLAGIKDIAIVITDYTIDLDLDSYDETLLSVSGAVVHKIKEVTEVNPTKKVQKLIVRIPVSDKYSVQVRLTVFNRMTKLLENIQVGDKVKFEAKIRSYPVKGVEIVDKNGKHLHDSEVVYFKKLDDSTKDN